MDNDNGSGWIMIMEMDKWMDNGSYHSESEFYYPDEKTNEI